MSPASRSALVVAIVFLGGACASVPAERFYTLNAGLGASVHQSSPPDGAPDEGAPRPVPPRSVLVVPPSVPELIDRPQMVVRTGVEEVLLLDQERWAEPLPAQIARVVAEDLEALLGDWQVATSDDVLVAPACRVHLDVRRFEASRAGPAVSDVLWRVACAGGSVRTGRSAAAEPVAGAGRTDGLAPVVAAHGRALDRLSRELVAALREAAR